MWREWRAVLVGRPRPGRPPGAARRRWGGSVLVVPALMPDASASVLQASATPELDRRACCARASWASEMELERRAGGEPTARAASTGVRMGQGQPGPVASRSAPPASSSPDQQGRAGRPGGHAAQAGQARASSQAQARVRGITVSLDPASSAGRCSPRLKASSAIEPGGAGAGRPRWQAGDRLCRELQRPRRARRGPSPWRTGCWQTRLPAGPAACPGPAPVVLEHVQVASLPDSDAGGGTQAPVGPACWPAGPARTRRQCASMANRRALHQQSPQAGCAEPRARPRWFRSPELSLADTAPASAAAPASTARNNAGMDEQLVWGWRGTR